MSAVERKYLSSYQPPLFSVSSLQLCFQLSPQATRVISTMQVQARHGETQQTLVLMGEDLNLISLQVNQRTYAPTDYLLTENTLSLDIEGSEAIIRIETEINPQNNSRLEGLYLSDDVFCTQCEAEGFRRITYFLDRPDVLTTYTTRIEADKDLAPVLLSNGNLIESGELDQQRHYAVWHDPFPKPSYLFALVAGNLVCQQAPFITAEGRKVSLEVYVKSYHAHRCDHALHSLASAMRWDEETFGRCYDLDRYMIVAVDDFNMGAMENKGLNVFNARYVLADPQTATDQDYIHIDSIIAHEYFHNWTGNRVTCRDWFQLTLKEGLTVYRDQLYTEQTLLGSVKRIDDVRLLRRVQFAEDASSLRHPIQPDSYVEMNNFYTATVYEKGAEVVRMYASLLGQAGFRRGMDLYFQRHDGQAVTVHEFRQAMADANQVDLTQMHAWYTQAGTPQLTIRYHWDALTQQLHLYTHQSIVGSEQTFSPLLIPLAMAIFNQTGERQVGVLQQGKGHWQESEGTLWLTKAEETFVFSGITQEPKLSLLRHFSAPVQLNIQRQQDDWLWQATYDDDLFNRWEAWQQLWVDTILAGQAALRAGQPMAMPTYLLPILTQLLQDTQLPIDWLSEVWRLPSFDYVAQQIPELDPLNLLAAIRQLQQWLGAQLAESMWQIIQRLLPAIEHFTYDAQVIAQRSWCHLLLTYLAANHDQRAFAWADQQLAKAADMTHCQTALTLLVHYQAPQAQRAIVDFYQRWKDNTLVLDKWFSIQAANVSATLADIQHLSEHSQFVRHNPNRVRSVLATFGRNNPALFHQLDGAGYHFLVQQVAQVDRTNPQIAARLIQAFSRWQTLSQPYRQQAQEALLLLTQQTDVSVDLREVLDALVSSPIGDTCA